MHSGKTFDLLVIGGGINGTGIALDAAGRGLSVILFEQHDLGSGTSSASTKLIHGGLRYLEQHDFKLVREALIEREILLNKARHLIHPMRFVIPYEPGLRPKWMIRIGLWLYDLLAAGSSLSKSRSFDFSPENPVAPPLAKHLTMGFEYSDCVVDDARLVVANALGAAQLGARIYTNVKVTSLHVENGLWFATTYDMLNHVSSTVKARAIANASGPWIKSFDATHPLLKHHRHLRLVRGSHIIVPKRYDGIQAYLIQNNDGRVIFVIPYENDFTMIGTTEVPTDKPDATMSISEEEKVYLIDFFNENFKNKISASDILWACSGVRPLVDDSSDNPSKLSRDYLLDTTLIDGVPFLSVYGGKITTHRILAESALDQLKPYFPEMRNPWTSETPLPGGDLAPKNFDDFFDTLKTKYTWIPEPMLRRLAKQQGTRIHLLLKGIESLEQMGQHFGADCYEHELRFLMEHEWARTTDDLLFRRTKLGLHMKPDEIAQIEDWLTQTLAV